MSKVTTPPGGPEAHRLAPTPPADTGTKALRPESGASPSFDVDPEEALQAIDAHRGPLLVDLDETLYLRNSTEDFIGSAWPGALAFLLQKALDLLAPWRLSGGVVTRDAWRVATIITLMPWSSWTWRRAARRLAGEAINTRLALRLRANGHDKIIVTLGFRQVVMPLIEAMGMQDMRVVAMNVWRFGDRRDGKLALVTKAVGEEHVCASLLVTDSLDDLTLLQTCARPLRVIWPEARFRPAFHDTYIPGLYISRVKRPGAKFIYRSIVSDDYALWVLGTLAIAAAPVPHVAGLALLSLSFWAIYEYGYVDNDRTGALHEKDPVLTRAFFEGPVRISAVQPWVWAAASGAAALALLRWPAAPVPLDFVAWGAMLVTTHFVFRLYNRTDKRTRIWLFAALQLLRIAALIAVVPVTMIGMLALCAHALARWVPYYIYRLTGTEWRNGEVGTARLLFFTVLAGLVAAVVGGTLLWSWTALALWLWIAFKARRELIEIVRGAHRIDTRR